ncbi:DUF349 domain-containing protein [Ornithinimicrobium sp. INDO-MA30-4]|uniref:DUF349 domain-containing protein n=1 Tax=Ornithinimicrobium sp. INDO-MA30-4 TaxID=2908651 RepID=UPI001F2FAAAC|nr:DUF349 domain-containing protein [Ornithinimicrobium sp. INDO-MA30-4]UJH71156.1 DUF349 domain-containing protein [Ornithinimicrobium sp. INDO-MA30-4]
MSEQPPTPKAVPRPPSPAQMAARKPAVPAAPAAPTPVASKEALAFGRVGEDGTVYVKTDDGERAIGSYPDATPEEALSYFARKYDELAATAGLLTQRLERTDVSAHDARDSLKTLKSQIGEANVVGDLAALEAQVTAIEAAIAERQSVETKARAQAKAEASGVRETLVGEAEGIAETEPEKMQWKAASARMRELFDEWKAQQRSGARLDKDVEHSLWQRFAAARNGFDKTRKAWFARLDQEQDQARSTKEALVEQAETLAKSDDWGSTAGEFKRLMQQWRNAGRARRSADDELWARFKAAQDSFFAAKDEVVAAEEAEFTKNLVVKEALLVEAEALLPIKNWKTPSANCAASRIAGTKQARSPEPTCSASKPVCARSSSRFATSKTASGPTATRS